MAGKSSKYLLRVPIYLAIIALIYFWPSGSPAPQNLPTVPEEKPEEAKEKEEFVDTKPLMPKATFYGWAHEELKDGGQRIHVVLRFESNFDQLAWEELKLRPPKRSGQLDLASGEGPESRPQPAKGMARIRFHLKPGARPFKEGRIFCWIHYLCDLEAGRRTTVKQIDEMLAANKAPDSKDSTPVNPPEDAAKQKD